jgi:hypothetical protein
MVGTPRINCVPYPFEIVQTPIQWIVGETIEDPKVFSRPWKIRMPLYRRVESNVQLLDYECHAENHARRVAGLCTK